MKPSGRNPFGHNRISSENALPTSPKLNHQAARSSSALGAAGGYRKPLHIQLTSSFDEDTNEDEDSDYSTEGKDNTPKHALYGSHKFSKSKPSLETLTEDDVSVTGSAIRDSLSQEDLKSQFSPDSTLSPQEQVVRRAASANQMRDIRDHMTDLKGRLSSLRDQARADSLKRRSLQSLRTPSPFTHAPVEQWYSSQRPSTQSSEALPQTEKPTSDTGSLRRRTDKPGGIDGGSIHEDGSDNEVADNSMLGFVDVVDEDEEMVPHDIPVFAEDDYEDDLRTEDGFDEYRDDFVDMRSDSEASMYHDSVQHQLSHEDREDAFDYEHFFLHSAMGSMTRRRMERRGSDTTYTSEESIETTRGPDFVEEKGHVRQRRGSQGSVSTVASFATATEGRSTRLDGNVAVGAMEPPSEPAEHKRTSSEQAKRATFGGIAFAAGYNDSGSDQSSRPPSSLHNKKPNNAHRPSVSSIGSSGTNRSFPLVNKPKSNGVLTPRDSPEQGERQTVDNIRSETSSLYDLDSMAGDNTAAAMTALSKDDQILVQRLVASLGKCVLGLTESGRASTESRVARKRIEQAKRVLEGMSD